MNLIACQQCQRDNYEESKFCYHCGTPLVWADESDTGQSSESFPTDSVSNEAAAWDESAAPGPRNSATGSAKAGAGAPGEGSGEDTAEDEPEGEETGREVSFGALLAERYRIKRRLGRGGMGNVFLAYDERGARRVALKFLNPKYWQSRLAYERFVREANICLDLTHPNIVRVYTLEEWRGQAFLAMEYLKGLTMRAWLQSVRPQSDPPDWDTIRGWLLQMLHALGYAHAKGIIHRDIKPSNVMLMREEGEDYRLVVMDFGIAKENEEKYKTKFGKSVGTQHYMAPEQRTEAAKVDARADIYSMGIVAYEILTGRIPRRPPKPINRYRQDLPSGVQTWLSRAIAENPERRFADVAEMIEALKSIEDDEPIAEHAQPAGASNPAHSAMAPAATPKPRPAPDHQHPDEHDEARQIAKNTARVVQSGRLSRFCQRYGKNFTQTQWVGFLEALKREGLWPIDEDTLNHALEREWEWSDSSAASGAGTHATAAGHAAGAGPSHDASSAAAGSHSDSAAHDTGEGKAIERILRSGALRKFVEDQKGDWSDRDWDRLMWELREQDMDRVSPEWIAEQLEVERRRFLGRIIPSHEIESEAEEGSKRAARRRWPIWAMIVGAAAVAAIVFYVLEGRKPRVDAAMLSERINFGDAAVLEVSATDPHNVPFDVYTRVDAGDWVKIENEKHQWTGLQPGRHTIEVRAINAEKIASKTWSRSISVSAAPILGR